MASVMEKDKSQGSSTSSSSSSILAPPKLSSSLTSALEGKSTFVGLKPSKLNPKISTFLNSSTYISSQSPNCKTMSETDEEKKDEKQQEDEEDKKQENEKQENGKENDGKEKSLFSSKKTTTTTAAAKTATTTTTTDVLFVFGENLTSRAQNFDAVMSKETKKDFDSTSESSSSESSVISSLDKSIVKSLSESAAEYQEAANAFKRKYEEVTVVTGEEDETNIIQLAAKLYSFDKGCGAWAERGHGTLRLNESGSTSRLVMRASGVHRVILNTNLFPGMTLENPTEKSIRLTGWEDGTIKIFLLSGSPKDIKRLFENIMVRLDDLGSKKSKISE